MTFTFVSKAKKRVLIGMLLLFVVFGAGVIWRVSLTSPIGDPERAVSFWMFDHGHNFTFYKALAEGRIQNNDFEKLDFTLPGESSFGDNVQYEVFNPKSPRAIWHAERIRFHEKLIFALSGRKPTIGDEPFPEELILGLTGGKSSKVLFNFRRTRHQAVTEERIYAVIPDLAKEACASINHWLKTTPKFENLEIPTTISPIVDDKEVLQHCVEVGSKFYWFIILGKRTV